MRQMSDSTIDSRHVLSALDLDHVTGGLAAPASPAVAMTSMLWRGGIEIWTQALKENPYVLPGVKKWATQVQRFWHAGPHDPAI
jgi:hypothetical protein